MSAVRCNAVNMTIGAYNNDVIARRQADMNTLLPQFSLFVEKIPQGGSVLDIGCAVGTDVTRFLTVGIDAIGIDGAQKMLDYGLQMNPMLQDKLILMDATKMTFDHNTFNGVWSRAMFLHLPPEDAEKVINDIYNILRFGGLFFMRTMHSVPSGQIERIEEFIVDEAVFGYRYIKTYQVEEMKAMLLAAGFNKVYCRVTRDELKKPISWLNAWAYKGLE